MKTAFYLRLAWKNLINGGQRVFIAFLCVAFGVMTLVAMTTMSKSIEKVLVLPPEELIGGDLTLDRRDADSLPPALIYPLEELKAEQVLEDFTQIYYTRSLTFRTTDSAEMHFPSTGMGVESKLYPLSGNLTIQDPAGDKLENIFEKMGDVVITSDLASTYRLGVGSSIILADLAGNGEPLAGQVKAIASDTPNHQGSKVYFSLQTAQALTGRVHPANTIIANAKEPAAAAEKLEALGWGAISAFDLANSAVAQQKTLALVLNILGVLGVLIGGMGIGNTMQVLLNQRRKDVAIWKAMGYTSRNLQSMYLSEAAFLGVGGSTLGVLSGVFLSWAMVGLFSRTTTILVHWEFSALQAILGFVIGILITLLFALWSVVSVSRTRPQALLQQVALPPSDMPLGIGIMMAAGMGLIFLFIVMWIVGSITIGLGVFFTIVIGLTIAGSILAILIKLIVKILPLRKLPLLKLSHASYSQRKATSIISLLALYSSVIILGAGAILGKTGQLISDGLFSNKGEQTVLISASAAESKHVKVTLADMGIKPEAVEYRFFAKSAQIQGIDKVFENPAIEAMDQPTHYALSGLDWDSANAMVYVHDSLKIPVGSQVTLTLPDSSTHKLTVAGTFMYQLIQDWPGGTKGGDFLIPLTAASNLFDSEAQTRTFLAIEPQKVAHTTQTLGYSLPNTTVVSSVEILAQGARMYQNLLVFIWAMAGLAALAGLILIANTTSLNMINRIREIGVLKALGYSKSQVLLSHFLEMLISILVVTVLGLSSLFLVLILMAAQWGPIVLTLLTPQAGILIMVIILALTFLVMLAAAWKPISVPPSEILRSAE